MRIRKCASKLLGLASVVNCPSSPPQTGPSPPLWAPPPPPPWTLESEAAAASAGIYCQLNCSPWDVMPNLEMFNFFQQEEEEDKGIMGNRFRIKQEKEEHGRGIRGNRVRVKQEPLSPIHNSSGQTLPMEDDEKKEKTKRTRKKKESDGIVQSERDATTPNVSVSCKKSDGKGWHCKRPAQLPHTLCNYHLSQLRSYSWNFSSNRSSDDDLAGQGSSRTRRKKNDSARGDANDFYYYYSSFGPWRGKTRGRSKRLDEEGCKDIGGHDSGASEEKGGQECSESAVLYDYDEEAPVAGDDEESIEEDNIGKGCDDIENSSVKDSRQGSEEQDEKPKRRKKGRKPIKARSLKSLL